MHHYISCKKGISNVVVVMLSLILTTVVVANVVLWSYQMNQLDWERAQEDVSIVNATSLRDIWSSNPSTYRLLNSTSDVSGSFPADLQTDNGAYMQFRSYVSAYSGTSKFGYLAKGGTSSTLSNISGSRFTCTSAGLANGISAYMMFTSSNATFGNDNTGSNGHSIIDTIRGQRFTSPSSVVVAQSIAAYIYCTTSAKNMTAAVYDSSGNLVAVTEQKPIPADSSPAWQAFSFTDPKPTLVASTNYVLVVWSQSGSGSADLRYSSGSGGNGRYIGQTYGNWPPSLTFSTSNYKYCIYCNYTTAFNAQAAIYSSNGSTRIATTGERTLTTVNDWVTFNFSSSPTLATSTDYVLVVWSSDTSNVNMYYDTGTVRYFAATATYPNWPASVTDQGSSATYSVYCTYTSAIEWTCEVEFTGSSNTENWTRLDWTIDSAWTAGSVNVTLQLYDFALGNYSTGGDGYMAYTSNGTPDTDENKSQTVYVNPTSFRNNTGFWKMKIKGAKTVDAQFDFKIDWIELKAVKEGGTSFVFKNGGPLTIHLVSLWLDNSTFHQRYDINIFINSGDTESLIISSIILPDKPYLIKVVTERGNSAIYSGS